MVDTFSLPKQRVLSGQILPVYIHRIYSENGTFQMKVKPIKMRDLMKGQFQKAFFKKSTNQ